MTEPLFHDAGADADTAAGAGTGGLPLDLSPAAAAKVQELVSEEGNTALKLRVFITGGGCSGLSYGFTFDDEALEDDATVQRDGVALLVDPLSYQYLAGARIDYLEDLAGARFTVSNPNAEATCGCGNSFAV